MTDRPRHVDLFSGIGGFALAAKWAGYQPVQFVEIDPFCRHVLAKHWPEVPIHDDIRTFDASPLHGTIDLLTGGFPCQPYSFAGKRSGASDDRALWPEMFRVIDEAQPRWIVAENVPGFIGLGLDDLLTDLERIGYETGALVVPAAGVGAPHLRQRLWVVAHAECLRGEQRRDAHEVGRWQGEAQQVGLGRGDVSHAEGGGCQATVGAASRPSQKWSLTPDSYCNAEYADSARHLAPNDQVQPERGAAVETGWWATEPELGRVAHGIPQRVDRLKSLGNAIVPHVAYEIIRHLIPSEVPL